MIEFADSEPQEYLARTRLATLIFRDAIRGPMECTTELSLIKVFSVRMGISWIDTKKALSNKGLLDHSGPWIISSHPSGVIVFHNKTTYLFNYQENAQVLLTREEIRAID